MKNRNVGFLISGVAIVIFFIIWIFNSGLKNIVGQTCSHGPSCTMYSTISTQTWLSVAIAFVILIIGIVFIFLKENERIVVRKVRDKQKEIDMSKLENDEREVVKIVQSEGGAIFQSSLMEKLESGKVKITRLLDKLEAKQIIERKRRGMNNIVVLKR